jgi:hypothetical protein
VLTKGMTDAECSATYGRMRAGEPMESIFPGAEFDPDPEPNLVRDALDGLNAREASDLCARLLRCNSPMAVGPTRENSLVRGYQLAKTDCATQREILREFFEELYDLAEVSRVQILTDQHVQANDIPRRT